MSLVSTPAIVLHAFKYGETSKIVRLLTLDLGLQSAVARGALRPRSKYGASLQPASEGTAHLYVKQNRELQTLGEFEVAHQRHELAADVYRYAVFAVLAELVLKFSAPEPHPRLYVFLREALDRICVAGGDRLTALTVASIWGVIGELGFTPALEECAVDGRPVSPGAAPFSVSEGGFVCDACARNRSVSRIPAGDRELLTQFIESPAGTGTELAGKTAAAHRRLVSRFIQFHIAEGREMKALDYWEHL